MSKRLFEILDIMNQSDYENKTELVKVSNTMTYAYSARQGGIISMGVDKQTLMDLSIQKSIAILVVVDKEEYFKLKDEA